MIEIIIFYYCIVFQRLPQILLFYLDGIMSISTILRF